MEFYSFVRSLFAWIASFACLPIGAPFLYAAHRVREAQIPEDDRMDEGELRIRSLYGSLAVAVVTWLFLFLDFVVADWLDLPAGLTHFIILLSYLPAAAYVLFLFFAYDDYFEGLGLLTLYLGLPIAALYIVNFLGLWNPVVGWFYSWLKPIV